MENIEEIIQLIKKVIDESNILSSKEDLYSYSFDASFGIHKPDLICQVNDAKEVSEIVKISNQYNIPIVPRGSGTCLSGGPLPVKGGIVLDFSNWNNKLIIDPEDLVAEVSPGVITAHINEKASEFGLMYPPDPSSSKVSTIGGNLSENAGGARGLKYGVTKDYVLGLEVVTPTGEIIQTGGRTVKNVTGYDLTKLIVGSEGTLAIITNAILRLVPKPLATRTAMYSFSDIVDSGKAISKILTSGILPSKMEIMDKYCIHAIEAYEPFGLPLDAEAILLVEVDGHPLAIDEEIKQMTDICKRLKCNGITVANTDEEANELWRARKLVSPAIVREKPTKISEDATVPIGKIPQMFQRLNEIREKYKVNLVVFGHAGDGNLHPNIIADARDHEEMKRVEQAVTEIFEAAIALGGTLSGEHGIGIMKAPFMELELGSEGLRLMKGIKEAWDPNGILNPGKIFPEPNQRLELTNG